MTGTGGSSAVVQPQEGCTERMVTGVSVTELVTVTVLVLVAMLATRVILPPRSFAQKPELVTAVKLVKVVMLVASHRIRIGAFQELFPSVPAPAAA